MDKYDVVIIGGGVSGTALLYLLSNFTNISKILLIEKFNDVAQVSSHYTQNSQTLHFGDIETNYSYEKAAEVNRKTILVKNYMENVGKEENIFVKKHKMAIGVGREEANGIRERVKNLKDIFPKIRLLESEEIKKFEPKVMEGRDSDEEVVALFSPDGYIMNYYNLAKSFVKHSKAKKNKIEIKTGLEVKRIIKKDNSYIIKTSNRGFETKFLVVDAGSMSIKFAKKLGYGKNLNVMSLAGNFYRAPETLNGKVYTWQHPKRPNAAFHGDPDISKSGYTRFGPTALILLMLERRNWKSVWDYFKVFNWTYKGWKSIFKIGFDKDYFFYMLENYLIEIPLIGRIIVSGKVKKIVPSIKWWQVKKDKGYGAARPQVINVDTGEVLLGEARIIGENAIFNVTPSPGASTCLANALRDTEFIVSNSERKYKFDKKKFGKELKVGS